VIVVCFDVAIIISFLLSFFVLGHYEKLEKKEINMDNLTTEDFTVVIKTMPRYKDYANLKELKAKLWNHLEAILQNEPHCNPGLEDSKADHTQIVNIYFGLTQFNRLKMYQNAYTDMVEKLRAQ
jgi:hypothetical protein